MTSQTSSNRLGLGHIKKGGTPIVCITAYTAPIARILDPQVDLILVGDSLGMVVYGFENTLSTTLDMMIAHGAAVVRSTSHAPIVVDMPYGTYEETPEQALRNAKRIMQETNCMAVKLEGGKDLAPTIKHLVDNDIPVMGHIGLLPQHVVAMGGYKIQGKDDAQVQKLMADAKAVADAGVFAMVVEGTIDTVAQELTKSVNVPTIGIGASVHCDGQILVIDDILSLTQRAPKFAKRFGDVATVVEAAVKNYANDVRSGKFPDAAHSYSKK